MTDDDDLPVLTHVLRTADGRAPPAERDARDDDVHAFDESPADPRIVIGNEALVDGQAPMTLPVDDVARALVAEPSSGDASTPSTVPSDASASSSPWVTAAAPDAPVAASAAAPAVAASPSPVDAPIVADPRHETRDAFRLVQDVDDLAPPSAPFDEPALVPTRSTLAGVATTADVDATIDFSLPSTAARVREAVLERIASRLDIELDARIAQAIHVEVETALAQLQGRLRTHLADALRDIVAKAVDDEVTRLGGTRHGPH